MSTAIGNINWMSLNILLACLGVLFGLMFVYLKGWYLKIPLFILWFLFIPNTIYLITDLQHFPKQFFQATTYLEQGALFIQFTLLFAFGIITYIFGMYPLHSLFPVFRRRPNPLFMPIVAIFNTLISFGVALGKIERTHSIYLFTQPTRVLSDIGSLLMRENAILTIIIFSLLCNAIFFSFYAVSIKMLKLK
jgi:uncharacterized membrane protein